MKKLVVTSLYGKTLDLRHRVDELELRLSYDDLGERREVVALYSPEDARKIGAYVSNEFPAKQFRGQVITNADDVVKMLTLLDTPDDLADLRAFVMDNFTND